MNGFRRGCAALFFLFISWGAFAAPASPSADSSAAVALNAAAASPSDLLLARTSEWVSLSLIQVDIQNPNKKEVVLSALTDVLQQSPFRNARLLTEVPQQQEPVLPQSERVPDSEWQRYSDFEKAAAAAHANGATVLILYTVSEVTESRLDELLVIGQIYKVETDKMIASNNKKLFVNYHLFYELTHLHQFLLSQAAVNYYKNNPNYLSDADKKVALAKPATITLTSRYEGATVYLDQNQPLGRIQNGQLELPFHPMAMGQKMKLLIEQKGFYPKTITLVLDGETLVADTGPLFAQTHAAVNVNYAFPSVLGLGIGGRYYPLPDLLFLELRENIFSTGFLKNDNGQETMLHFDTSFLVAYYPIFPVDFPFRISIGVGGGYLASVPLKGGQHNDDWYLTMCNLSLECNLPSAALYFAPEVRFYNPWVPAHAALGVGLPSHFPLLLNVGVLWKL